MAEESITLPIIDNVNLDYHIVTLFEKIEAMRLEAEESRDVKLPFQVEIRTLEFYRAVICECIASFIFVLIVCGATAASGAGASLASVILTTSLSSGFAMMTLHQCFAHISGANINPAVSVAMGITKRISVLRSLIFIIAECGGGIAGAAFIYGVTAPGYQGNVSSFVRQQSTVAAFGLEFILTFIVVLTYFVSTDKNRKWNSSPLSIGAAYAACTFVSMPYLNPAISLGPSFVLNKYDNHWVYWLGPCAGGAVAGIVHDYILNPKKHKLQKDSTDGDSSSIHSDEDTYDDLDKPTPPKFHGSTYNTYRPSATAGGPSGYCPSLTSTSLYSAPPTKLERVESLYGGTKSLYCKSPPLTRANLNRSQSVYTKSNSAVNKDSTLPRPGPLVPAQSLYPMRLNQPSHNHIQNQNVQNQLQQRSEGLYGIRGVTPGTSSQADSYSTRESERNYPSRTEDSQKQSRARPDSMYGVVTNQPPRRSQTAHSDDSSYGSYHGSSQRHANHSNSISNGTYNAPNVPQKGSSTTNYAGRTIAGQEMRQSPPAPLTTSNGPSSFHRNIAQHSPNPQY